MSKRKEVAFSDEVCNEIMEESKKQNVSSSEYIKNACNKNLLMSKNIENFCKIFSSEEFEEFIYEVMCKKK